MHKSRSKKSRCIRICTCFCYLVFILFFVVQCNSSNKNNTNVKMKQPSVKEVIKEHAGKLMSVPGVVGVYEGKTEDGKPCIKIMVEKKSKEIDQNIPPRLEGYPVIVEVTGKIKPLQGEKEQDNK